MRPSSNEHGSAAGRRSIVRVESVGTLATRHIRRVLSPLVHSPPAISGGEKDNGDDSEYRELACTSHGYSPLVQSLDQLFYSSAPAARYEFRILSPFD